MGMLDTGYEVWGFGSRRATPLEDLRAELLLARETPRALALVALLGTVAFLATVLLRKALRWPRRGSRASSVALSVLAWLAWAILVGLCALVSVGTVLLIGLTPMAWLAATAAGAASIPLLGMARRRIQGPRPSP